ncbi:unnamed protein product, partial [Nesidiocoris tenuis]
MNPDKQSSTQKPQQPLRYTHLYLKQVNCQGSLNQNSWKNRTHLPYSKIGDG